MQQKLVDKATEILKEKTNTEVSIGHIQLDIFRGLFANQVYIEDQNKDTLLYVETLQVDYSIKNIYKKQTICLSKIGLSDFVVKLSKTNDSADYNFQFIVDAFSSPEKDTTKAPSNFKMDIGDITLSNGRFHHDILSEEETLNLFNANHLFVNNINAELSLDMSLPEINVSIDHLSAKEKSGLSVKNIQTEGSIHTDSLITIKHLYAETPNSSLTGEDIHYNFKNTDIKFSINDANLIGADFQCFTDFLKDFKQPLQVKGNVSMPFPKLNIRQFTANYDNNIALTADQLQMEDVTNWEQTYYSISNGLLSTNTQATKNITDIFKLELPAIVDSLLPASLTIFGEGHLTDINLNLLLSSTIGTVTTNGNLSYLHSKKQLSATNVWDIHSQSLSPILQSEIIRNLDGSFQSTVDWDLSRQPKISLSGSIDSLNLMDYSYKPLTFNGELTAENQLSATFSSIDTNLNVHLSVKAEQFLSDSMGMDLQGNIHHLAPYPLHFIDTLDQLTVAGNIHLNGRGFDIDKWVGTLTIDSLRLNNDSSSLALQQIKLTQQQNDKKETELTTPFIHVKLNGNYSLTQLVPNTILQKYLPTFFHSASQSGNSKFTYDITINDTKELASFLGMDIDQKGAIHASGDYSEPEKKIDLELTSPLIEYKGLSFSDTQLNIKTIKDHLTGNILTNFKPDKHDSLSVDIKENLVIRNDSIFNMLKTQVLPDSSRLMGIINNCISFTKLNNDEYEIKEDIIPSIIQMNHKNLKINPSSIRLLKDKVVIDNLGFTLEKQPVLLVNGTISKALTDTLHIALNDLKLSTILPLLFINNFPADCTFNGDMNANAILSENFRFGTKNFRADNIIYNGTYIGDLETKAMWSNVRKGVFVKTDLNKENKHLMDIIGVVLPAKETVRMTANLDSLPLITLLPFIEDYVSNTKGYIGANIKIDGNYLNPSIKGSVRFQDAQAKINYTGVTYYINDSLKMEGNRFYVKQFNIHDDHAQKLTLNGEIEHNEFKEFKYNLTMKMNDFAILKNPKDKKNMVYGNFYINGKDLTLKGTEKGAVITGDLSNADKTQVYINLPETVTEAYNYDNIVYVKTKEQEQEEQSIKDKEKEREKKDFDLKVDLNIGLTDKAQFNISIAEGAMIKGNGNLRLSYEDGNIGLYNRLTANEGYLKIKLSGLPIKKFTLQEGSYVEFNGDPMKLKFNATATYSLTADLNTLSPQFATMGLSSTKVPVDCNLIASGDLENLSLAYDIATPNADENVKQAVKSIINTDKVKIKEFAYLIGIGMFNDPSNQVDSESMMLSFASSSLTSTLNHIFESEKLSKHVSFGTNFNTNQEDFSDVEAGVSVSSKLLNDKLIISTDLGVQKNGASSKNDVSFKGDFDVEYLLGKKGMFRVKAYNHSNNEFYHNSNNTQGVGFSFVRESKTFRGLYHIKDDNNQNSTNDSTTVKRRKDKHEK